MNRVVQEVWPSLAAFAFLVVVWQYGTIHFDVPSYLIPKPSDIGQSLYKGLVGGMLWPHVWATMKGMFGGFLIGAPLGLLAAALLSEYRIAERAFYPLLVAFQSIPKVALAPVVIVWFGFGLESKVVLVALMCFFPSFINGFSGLRSFNRDLADMFRVFGASRLKIFRRVKLPAALPHMFAGFQISMVLAVLGTVLSEMIAAQRGLGHVIQSSSVNFDMPMMFACTVVLAVIGVSTTRLLMLAQARIVFWERGSRSAAQDL